MRSFLGRDILTLKDFGRDDFFRVFQVADDLRPDARDRRNGDLLKDKTLLTAFYQPSTRTRLSTEAAMHRLGGHVLGFADAKMTRAGDFYQESIKDTFRMLESYGDVIAIRHFQEGAPAEAASWSSVPIINCGDGWGEHPTQVLTDLYTILLETRHARRPHLPARRRHAHADDALDPVRAVAVRRRGDRRQPARHGAAARVQGRARRPERGLPRGPPRSPRRSARPTSSTWSRSSRRTTRSRASSAPARRAARRRRTR